MPERWCQPKNNGQDQPRTFMVVFDDSERGSAVFDDEEEARAFYDQAKWNWNCYLFGTLPERDS